MADLCHAVGTIASVAPYEADDLDWLGGMGPENVEEFTLARAGGPEFDTFIAEGVRSLSETTADNLVSSMAGLISSVDEEALFEVDLAAVLAESARHGASSGPDGWIEDDEALMSSWGFSVAEVQVPVSLWHGSDDLMVPRPHGEWLAANLPDVSTHLFGEEGHLSLVTRHLGEVLDEVMSLGGI
jgi:pimeloyl-ACP methyl ester carboxylesterase